MVRYHKTEAGLAQALNVLIEKPSTETRLVARTHPTIRFGKKAEPFTESEREGVRAVLKKQGII